MPSYLYPVATAVPGYRYPQAMIGERFAAQVADRRLGRLMKQVYQHSGIAWRHSVLEDFASDSGGFYLDANGRFGSPGTGARNDRYRLEAGPLLARAARGALANCPGLDAEAISHVITVSCTGFFSPGPDYVLMRELGLSPTTPRYHLGFMGCYAAFPALELADTICRAQPGANVLVVSLELCSLHLQPQRNLDAVLSASLFADGCAAGIVSSRTPQGERALLLEGFQSVLLDQGEADMAWSIGDQGFEMVLSSYVPELLGQNVASLTQPLLGDWGVSLADVPHWAVHPGGRAILDQVEAGLALAPEQLAASRDVLCGYGNMSSATVLFVLQALQQRAEPGERVVGLAFGPGLTVASGRFRRV